MRFASAETSRHGRFEWKFYGRYPSSYYLFVTVPGRMLGNANFLSIFSLNSLETGFLYLIIEESEDGPEFQQTKINEKTYFNVKGRKFQYLFNIKEEMYMMF